MRVSTSEEISPLAKPFVVVSEGIVIVEINGPTLALKHNTAGKQVLLTEDCATT